MVRKCSIRNNIMRKIKMLSLKINWYYENAPGGEHRCSTTRRRGVTLGMYLFPYSHFFLAKLGQDSSGIALSCWFGWVGAGQLRCLIPRCRWHLTALAGTSPPPGPEPGAASPHLLTAARLGNGTCDKLHKEDF